MTEMRRATWSGLDGRVVIRNDRKVRAQESIETTATDEKADEVAPPSPVAVDPSKN